MLESKNRKLSILRQSMLLGITRSSYYYKPRPKHSLNFEYIKELEMAYLKHPIYGYRRLNQYLCNTRKVDSTQKKTRNSMKRLGLCAIYPKPKLSVRNQDHKVYPYLLKNLEIEYKNQVWSTDITYIRLNGAFVYLTAIIDIFSRKVLSWRLSNTMDVSFCIDVLNEAICKYGKPEIFNTDQGSQYTSKEFTDILKRNNIQISMDGKGRALDNVYIERLWRSLKYENIFLNEYNSMKGLRKGINKYFEFYNSERFHQSLDYSTPNDIYFESIKKAGSF
jgi:putative transposase